MYYITIQDVKAIIGDRGRRHAYRRHAYHRHGLPLHGERPDARQDVPLPPGVQEARCGALRRHDWDDRHAGDYDEESAADDASAAGVAAAGSTCPR